jgi:hypothetical protein
MMNLTLLFPSAAKPHQKSPLVSYPNSANFVAKLSMVSTAPQHRIGERYSQRGFLLL